jgi:hypothetical protein
MALARRVACVVASAAACGTRARADATAPGPAAVAGGGAVGTPAPSCARDGDVSLAARVRRLEAAAGLYEWAADLPYPASEAACCRRLGHAMEAGGAGAGAMAWRARDGAARWWSYDSATRETVFYYAAAAAHSADGNAAVVLADVAAAAGAVATDGVYDNFRVVLDARVGGDAPGTVARLGFWGGGGGGAGGAWDPWVCAQ